MPIRHVHQEGSVERTDLYWVALDLVIEGTVLALTIRWVRGFDGLTATVIAIYLAGMFVVRILVGTHGDLQSMFQTRIVCSLLVVLFSAWLLWEGKTVRSGWYRTHVIQNRVHQIVTDAPASILIADLNGRITSVSRELAQTLGYSHEALIGTDARRLIPKVRLVEFDARLEEARQRLKGVELEEAGWLKRGVKEFSLVRKDGTILTGHIYSGAIRWSEVTPFEGDSDVFAIFVADEGRKP